MTRLHVLIASLILVSAPLAGCLSEELVDEVLGCMDENAANYDDNATAEALGDCLYMASMEVFLQALDDEMSLESMLEETPRAGYSEVVSINEWNEDIGMQMDITMEEHVMVDLANVSVMVRTVMSMPPMLTMDYQFIQVGQVVNIHSTMSGMMNEDGPISHSAQTRDADASSESVLETVYSMLEGSMMDSDELGGDDEDDITDDMPADAEMTFSMDESDGTQMMSMSFTEDGTETAISIKIDEGNDLSSYAFATDNGSATMSMSYTVYWDDAVVIEVDETLPRTSIPIWVDMAHDEDSDDGEDTFDCDNGNEIPMDYVDDGWDDCGDGSDESEPAMICYNSHGDYFDHFADQDTCYSWMWLENYTSEHDPDGEPFTGCYNSHTHTQNEWMSEEECTSFMWVDEHSFDDDDDTFYCDNGNEIPMDYVDDGDNDCGDWSDESDDQNDIYWESYYGGYCEWEGDPDGDDTVWWCKESQDDEYWNTWWYYCEHHDSDWHCTDDFGQSEEFEHSADGDEWSGSDDDDDGDGPPTPEEAMGSVDANGDGLMSLQEFQDSWDSDEENPELDYDEVSIMFDDCDYDGSDLIDIDEMQCFIDGIVDMLPDGGDENPEQMFSHMDTDDDGYVSLQDLIDFSNEGGDDSDDEIDEEGLSNWFSWCDTDGDDMLSLDEFTTCVEDDGDDESDDHDDGDDHDDHGDQHEMPAVLIGYIAKNQTLNAPISDFETHFLSDCDEEYDEETGEMVEPDLDECTVEFSIPLSGGEANGVTHTYDDLDGDGLVSPGDMLTLEGWDGQTRLEMYDTWASEYSSDSVANPPALPGFGAMLAVMTLLGAAFASRRD